MIKQSFDINSMQKKRNHRIHAGIRILFFFFSIQNIL
eukprot:UN26679